MNNYPINSNKPLHCAQPLLLDSRNDSRLVVWSELGQWMVVDDELLGMLCLFNGKRTTNDVAHILSKRTGKSQHITQAEMRPIMKELHSRKIVSHSPFATHSGQKTSKLENITLNLTNRCNLKCPFCYNSGRDTDEMDIERLMDRVEEHKELYSSKASFIILGGEPFISPERLFKTIDRANTIFTNSPPMVSTNGTLIDEVVVKELARRRVEVQVSLDSHDPAVHDKFRGKGVYKQTLRGVKMLVEAEVYVVLSMVMTKENISGMENYLDMALALRVNEARFIPLRLIGRGKELLNRSPDQREALDILLTLLNKRPEFRPLLRRDYFSIQMTMAGFSANQSACGVGEKVIFIDADGKVYPCPNHVTNEHICGSLAITSLAEIFKNSPVLENIRKKYHVKNYKGCSECSFKCWCAGDCRGEVLSLTGDPFTPSPHCSEIKGNYLKLLWYMADDNFYGHGRAGAHICF